MRDQAITMADEPKLQLAEESLEALFKRHHRRVYLAAYRVVGTEQDAEDVLQAVFLRLLKPGSGLTEEHLDPAGYLCRAAINMGLDMLRRHRRQRRHLEAVVADESGAASDADPSTLAEADAWRRQQREQLRVALLALSPRAAEIFALRYFEEYGNAEIADIVGTTSSTVAVTLHRTRDRLRVLLREFEGDDS